MSDIPALALALVAGALLGAFFFGGLWWTVQKGVDVREAGALVPRQPAAANRCDSGWILFCFAGSLVEARGVPPWISDRPRHRREVAHTTRRRKSRLHWKRRPALRLSPDELVFWRYGFVVLNSTIVTTWALMLVMTVGAMLITRKLKTEGHISRWQGFLEIVVTTIQRTDQRGGPAPSGEVSRLYWHLVSVHRGVQPLRDPPRVRTTDRFALDHVGAGDLRVCRRAALRHRGARAWAVTSSPT